MSSWGNTIVFTTRPAFYVELAEKLLRVLMAGAPERAEPAATAPLLDVALREEFYADPEADGTAC